MLQQKGGFRGQAIYWCHLNLPRPTLVAMVTKI